YRAPSVTPLHIPSQTHPDHTSLDSTPASQDGRPVVKRHRQHQRGRAHAGPARRAGAPGFRSRARDAVARNDARVPDGEGSGTGDDGQGLSETDELTSLKSQVPACELTHER